MDNSQHLKQNFDTKAYHFVHCDCKCRRNGRGTNRCARCGHIRVTPETEYITQIEINTPGNEQTQYTSLMKNPNQKLQIMLKKQLELKKNR